jgi:hypothetical protein
MMKMTSLPLASWQKGTKVDSKPNPNDDDVIDDNECENMIKNLVKRQQIK